MAQRSGKGLPAAVITALLSVSIANAVPDTQPDTQPEAPPATSQPVARGAARSARGAARAGARGAARAGTLPSTGPAEFTLNFKDAPLDSVLNYFSQTGGFEIVNDGPIDARVTLMSKQPVGSEQALAMLIVALHANGFTVIRQGQLLHIGSRDNSRRANVPVHFGANPDDIADTDEMITQVIPLSNLNAVKLQTDLKPLLSPDADITANEGSNTIIMTDTSASIRHVAQIVFQMDSHEESVSEIRIVQLKDASATVVGKLIEAFFKGGAEPAAAQNNGLVGPRGNPGQPPPPAGGPERHGQNVVVAADDRTNTLLIMASNTSLKAIDDIIAHLDTDASNPVQPVATRVFTLKFAAADATAKLINNVFKAGGGPQTEEEVIYSYIYGNRNGNNSDENKEVPVTAVSDDRTNIVIVTGPSIKMDAVKTLVEQLDAAPTVTQDLRIIHLKFADADDVAKLVQDMFSPKKDEGEQPNPFIYLYRDTPDDEQKVRGVQINVSSDSRTNDVLVSAPTAMLDGIEGVVHQLDSDPSTEDSLFIYHLRNSQSDHLAYTLNVLFGNISNPAPNNNEQNQPGQQQFNPNGQNQTGSTGIGNANSNTLANASSPTSNNRNTPGRSGGGGGGAGRGGIAQAYNELTNKVLVVSDPDTNSLLVTTASKYERQVRSIIDDLDKPVQQVLIKMLIAEVSRDDTDDIGADFSVLNLRASGKGQEAITTFGEPTSGLVVSVLEDQVTATLHALAIRGKLDVLSRPYILASDNQDASITVGQSVPFISQSVLDVNSNTINTVLYKDIGIILNVTPHINPDGQVILDVSPEISAITQNNLTLSQGVSSPIFTRRAANSRVGVLDGQTVVIGGLMQDENNTTLSKVPLLGDLPLIGPLFSRNQVEKQKTELLIFLTPHVAPSPGALKPMSQDEMKGTKLTPDAVAPGVFQEQMEGMQRGQNPQTRPASEPSPVNQIDLSQPPDRLGN